MARLGRVDSEAVVALVGRLRSLDIAAPIILPTILPLIAAAAGAERAFGYSIEPSGELAVSSVGFDRADELADVFSHWHADVERLAEALAAWDLVDAHLSRILIVDGPTTLGSIGLLLPRPANGRDGQLLGALVPALRERWLLERRLATSAFHEIALDAALDAVPGAAFILRRDGEIVRANAAGRVTLDREGVRLRSTLAAALHGGDHSYQVRLLSGAARGHAMLIDKEPARVQQGVRSSNVARFGLTPRQSEVLELLVQGNGNREIAGLLGCAERTVEVHISQIFEKTGVATRTALIARIWQMAS
jgi:DNA-binding CsgD family transcriptional regulator